MIIKEILCYPRFEEKLFEERLKQLAQLGIEDIIEGGGVMIAGRRVLGKGTTAIVVKALRRGEVVALKIRRTDSNRESMEGEAMILNKLNDTGIAPKLLGYSKDFIVMEYIEGISIGEFLESCSKLELLQALRSLILACYTLDRMKIDHGDLVNASDHVIVESNKRARIIDFESASLYRRPQNLTSILSYLFLSKRPFTSKLYSLLSLNEAEILRIAKEYKKNPEKAIEELLSYL